MMQLKPVTEKKECAIVESAPLCVYRNEEGVAIIMALIMLLVMSVLATTVSFNSNNDFRAMSNYKRGQEAFLAAENCVREARHRFEIIGIEYMFLLRQNKDTAELGELSSKYIVLNEELGNNARCRSGARFLDSTIDGPGQIIEVPPPTKTLQRPLKNTSMSTSASGGAGLVPTSFVVTGKDQGDKDIDDVKNTINTGTEIAAGYETFVPGNMNPMYSQ